MFDRNWAAWLLLCVASAAVVAFGLIAAPAVDAQTPRRDAANLNLIPWPHDVRVTTGRVALRDDARIVAANDELVPLAHVVADELHVLAGRRLAIATGAAKAGDIALAIDPKLAPEAHTVTIGERIAVTGGDYNGVAMGTVTLVQALDTRGNSPTWPRLTINDRPSLQYTGAMLDVARKPHSIATLRACVDAARHYKIRFLHLHLTDENAWTFPSKTYPQLGTQNFAWAGGEAPTVYDYDELKELIAYADARGVTLVPELETPGHSGQLRGTMPEVFGYLQPDGARTSLSIINIANENAYEVLDVLIGEAAELFASSPYIHIGCDEASLGGVTEELPEVKAVMEQHGLKHPHDIFSVHIKRMHEMVTRRGKQMIVWQGAPLGPIAPPKDIIWMPWVHDTGFAATLVQHGYRVINAPWGVKSAYMDAYEVNGAQLQHGEPLLIGATAILWEATEDRALPFMRYSASLRNEPTYNTEANRGLDDFVQRLAHTDHVLDRLVHRLAFRAEGVLGPEAYGSVDPSFTNAVTLTLEPLHQGGNVRYTLDGSMPTSDSPVFDKPLRLTETTTVSAVWFSEDGLTSGYPFQRSFVKVNAIRHDGVGAKVTFGTPVSGSYPGKGAAGLTDGLLARGEHYSSRGWVGFEHGKGPGHITIDLGRPRPIRNIMPRFLRTHGGIDLPAKVEVQASNDGERFETIATIDQAQGLRDYGWFVVTLQRPITARYVRLLPTHSQSWLFIDEFVINGARPGGNIAHAAVGRNVTAAEPAADYNTPGPQGLTDGRVTDTPTHMQIGWLGYERKGFEATIDMGRTTPIRTVSLHCLQMAVAGVYLPSAMEIHLSNDGRTFTKAAQATFEPSPLTEQTAYRTVSLDNAAARYVKVVTPTNGSWIFVDEVIVNPDE